MAYPRLTAPRSTIVLSRWRRCVPHGRKNGYRSQTTELFEFRITGDRVQYRPLGTYWGKLRYALLAGAIEKGDKIPRSDVETAERRLSNLRKDPTHAVIHQFDDE
jgi:hypothetical protein